MPGCYDAGFPDAKFMLGESILNLTLTSQSIILHLCKGNSNKECYADSRNAWVGEIEEERRWV